MKKIKIQNSPQQNKFATVQAKLKNAVINAVILVLLIVPLSAQAFFLDDWFEDWFFDEEGTTQVINEVKVEANTGGNKADEGEVIEGEGEINVEIKTIINGEEIEPIEIETEANEVKVESEIRVENEEVIVEREIEINSENLCDSCNEVGTEDKGVIEEKLKVVKNWWSDFIKDLKSLVINIFNIF